MVKLKEGRVDGIGASDTKGRKIARTDGCFIRRLLLSLYNIESLEPQHIK